MFLLAIGSAAHASPCTSIALVLSVDSSSSVEDWEFELERRGLAQALREPEVQSALLSSGPIKLALLFWGDAASGIWSSGWHLVSTPGDAERFAGHIDRVPRSIGGDTALGVGLGAALSLLSQPEACASRRIVNITGDGRETLTSRRRTDLTLAAARAIAADMNVTINGLAIANEEADLADYYRRSVILGPNSFVMEVRDLEDYATAIRRKIIRETGIFVADIPSSRDRGAPNRRSW